MRYYLGVIKSFADSDTQLVFRRQRSRRIPQDIHRRAHRKLLLIDAAEVLDDLRAPPGNRLHALRGDRADQHAIRINDQWRICFRWEDGNAYEVEIADYHDW